ncbi:MAG: hypothetical protein K2N27_02555 [Ruminococcus sp.]|nr:hypothetical protein [Ruminococcus sp.]
MQRKINKLCYHCHNSKK